MAPTAYHNKPALCFVAHAAYGALKGGCNGHIGGAERQQAMIAKWLAKGGWRVSMVTWDEGQPQDEVVDGVRVIKMCRQDAGIKGVRFLHPKWTSLVHALRAADADVYYQNCGGYETGQVALWCRNNGRRFVYSVASDPDCDPRLPAMRSLRDRILYRYGVRHADCVIVQTLRQQETLRRGFGVSARVVPMPCAVPSDGTDFPRVGSAAQEARVLWVGRVCEVKRPDILLEVARACPGVPFDLVGPSSDAEYCRGIMERASQVPNITAHGRVPCVWDYYAQAASLLCTSDYEGFPNTFLEAWSQGLPVVSTFDPDDLIARRELGLVAGDVTGLAAAIRRLLTSPDLYRRLSHNARQYYLQNHTVEIAMPRFEQVFLDVLHAS
jgi:glycosyltransferase involved in cell wall biosynthesis